VTSPEIDAYIAAAPAYAQPVLQHVRSAFHRVCPEVTESIKWRHPSFGYRGKILAGMAAWKDYVRFHFWNDVVLRDSPWLGHEESGAIQLRSRADLPADAVLDAYIAEAIRLAESGVKPSRSPDRAPKPGLAPPPGFLDALQQQPAAEKTFAALSPSHRREYLEWIIDAKREPTRVRRIQTAIEWLSEGKPLHWKYERGASQSKNG
jgi:uncharacterized protein YdeI (YjbR/CyaY-like superfamily)